MSDEFIGKIVRFAWPNAWGYRSGTVHHYDIDDGNVVIRTFDMEFVDVPVEFVLGFMQDGVFVAVEFERDQRD